MATYSHTNTPCCNLEPRPHMAPAPQHRGPTVGQRARPLPGRETRNHRQLTAGARIGQPSLADPINSDVDQPLSALVQHDLAGLH